MAKKKIDNKILTSFLNSKWIKFSFCFLKESLPFTSKK